MTSRQSNPTPKSVDAARRPAAPVFAVHAWASNAALIADVAKLGYLHPDGLVCDVTYGRGTWWSEWRPDTLVTHDLALDGVDFRHLPEPDSTYDAVAFDPPYKLNGTPALGDFDHRYGINVAGVAWSETRALIRDGIAECARVLKRDGVLLLKCADQVCSGKVRWQTDEFSAHAATVGLDKVDRFDLVGRGRPQPAGRAQQHARRNSSTLLVFQRGTP